MHTRRAVAVLALLLSTATGARAQRAEGAQAEQAEREPSGERAGELSDSGGYGDPLGIGATVDLERIRLQARRQHEQPEPAPDADVGPEPAGLPVVDGEVVRAVGSVREVAHRVDIKLEDGLARVSVEMRFAQRGKHAAEVRYRLAVPEDAALASLTVCGPPGCRDGVADRSAGDLSVYDDAVRSRPPEGEATDEPPLPVAHARPADDERGRALVVRAAPVPVKGELRVQLAYLTAAPLHGGVVRLRLPARGRDPRAAKAAVTARAESLLAPTVAGNRAERTPTTIEPWHAADVVARIPTGRAPQAEALSFECGDRTCVRARVAAGPKPGAAVELVLLLDASPSMEGPARNRLEVALRSLLASVPDGSRVRVGAFGAEARSLVASPAAPTALDPAELAEEAMEDFGAATRFDTAWPLAREWLAGVEARARRVVIVGDGALTHGDRATEAFAQAAQMGVQISAVSLADRGAWSVLREGAERTGGVVVQAGAAAERALGGDGGSPLEERLSALFAPVLVPEVTVQLGRRGHARLGALRAGEEHVWEGAVTRDGVRVAMGGDRIRARRPSRAEARALAVRVAQRVGVDEPRAVLAAVDPASFEPAVQGEGEPDRCGPRGPAHDPSGVSTDAAPIALAEPRSCEAADGDDGDAPPKAELRAHRPSRGTGVGIPANTVRRLVRQRVIPVARRCLRRDRAGRPDYSVRAAFDFELADREIVAAQIEGDIRPELRQCLLDAVHALDVPRFRGVVKVRYPIYTERAPEPPQIELRPGVAREVDRIAGEQPTEPPPSPEPDAPNE